MRNPVNDYRLTSYDRSILPNPLLAMLEAGVRGPKQWTARSGRTPGHPGWGLLYHLALAQLSPHVENLVVETDASVGSTTLVLAQALEDSGRSGVVRALESDRALLEDARQRAELVSLQTRIEFLEGTAAERLPEACTGAVPVQLAVFGGHHSHDTVVANFAVLEPKLADGAMVVFDHSGLSAPDGEEEAHVHSALGSVLDRWGGHLIALPFCSWGVPGMTIWQRDPFASLRLASG